jgi:hypothetical protein
MTRNSGTTTTPESDKMTCARNDTKYKRSCTGNRISLKTSFTIALIMNI